MHVVLLDWEKAFDKITHTSLIHTLERFSIPDKIIKIIKGFYKNPTFRVKLAGKTSELKRQHSGIRQGCPLSPFLFLTVMTAIWNDINGKVERNKIEHPRRYKRTAKAPPPSPFSEVLYADDTIMVGHKPREIQERLVLLEKEASKYGLKLNKTKCEHLGINATANIMFKDSTVVKTVSKAKYLGVILTNKAEPNVEANERIRQCTATWKQMDKYWKLGKCSRRRKLQVRSAVIRSKLTYAMYTIQLNTSVLKRLDAFQAKGIRKILKWKTTYEDRTLTNKALYEEANKIMIKDGERRPPQIEPFMKISKYIARERIRYMGHLLRELDSEPTRKVTFVKGMTINIGWKQRVGRPRHNWIICTLREIWKQYRTRLPFGRRHTGKKRKFNIKDNKVLAGLIYGAMQHDF